MVGTFYYLKFFAEIVRLMSFHQFSADYYYHIKVRRRTEHLKRHKCIRKATHKTKIRLDNMRVSIFISYLPTLFINASNSIFYHLQQQQEEQECPNFFRVLHDTRRDSTSSFSMIAHGYLVL